MVHTALARGSQFAAVDPGAVQAIAAKLQASASRLRSRGLSGLWVFGSVARGEANRDRDIDLPAEFDCGARITLVTLSSLRAELTALLGAPADLIERNSLLPRRRRRRRGLRHQPG